VTWVGVGVPAGDGLGGGTKMVELAGGGGVAAGLALVCEVCRELHLAMVITTPRTTQKNTILEVFMRR